MRHRRYRPRARSVVLSATALTATAALVAALLPHAGPAQSAHTAGGEDHLPFQAAPLLPDPFTTVDGTPVTSEADWADRRAEIRELAQEHIYGPLPADPEQVSGSVSDTTITVEVVDQGNSAQFSASVDLPAGTGPFPAVVVLGGFGADTETLLASGAAVIGFDPYQVGAEGTSRDNKQGAFYDLYGSDSDTGLLMAWSWGVSRVLDVIEQADGSVLSTDTSGVTGCSRFGKGAFAAGAFDERIDLTMPIESGTAGVPALRAIAQESEAQPLDSAYSEEPWLGDTFGSYTDDPAALPVDMHEVVGLVAPRGLFVMENPHVDWLGAESGSVAALGGAEIYTALGVEENISYWSDTQDGTHCAPRPEWSGPLQQSIEAFLLGTGTAPGTFEISPQASGDLSAWRDWQTPDLTGGAE